MSKKEPIRPSVAPLSYNFKPIDPLFHSAYSKRAFEECLICNRPLASGTVQPAYFIMKTFVHDETIVELAVCAPCRTRMAKDISAASTKALSAFFAERLQLSGTIASCAICHQLRGSVRSSTLYAYCLGRDMLVGSYPFMLCDHCEEEAQDLMSEETRGWQNDFIEQYFSGPGSSVDPHRVPLLI